MWICESTISMWSSPVDPANRSLRLQSGGTHQGRQPFDLAAQDLVVLFRCARRDDVADVLQALLDVGQSQNTRELLVELREDRAWGAGRRDQSMRGLGALEFGKHFAESGNVGEHRSALRRRH